VSGHCRRATVGRYPRFGCTLKRNDDMAREQQQDTDMTQDTAKPKMGDNATARM
jgi:hypothetical protein